MAGKIYVTADHGGWAAKRRLLAWLAQAGYPVIDIGPTIRSPSDDYPVWTARAARLVQRNPSSRAIVICRSGVGMAIVANKFSGIRAVQGWSVAVAKRSRQDEDTNVLSLAADYQTWKELTAITRAWLTTPFRPIPRYRRRLKEIGRIEHAG